MLLECVTVALRLLYWDVCTTLSSSSAWEPEESRNKSCPAQDLFPGPGSPLALTAWCSQWTHGELKGWKELKGASWQGSHSTKAVCVAAPKSQVSDWTPLNSDRGVNWDTWPWRSHGKSTHAQQETLCQHFAACHWASQVPSLPLRFLNPKIVLTLMLSQVLFQEVSVTPLASEWNPAV
jgi:hypothetical protein